MRAIQKLLVVMWLGVSGVAGADDFLAESSTDVSLKAPGGQYQARTSEISPTGPSALRARITLSKFESHPEWATSFHFAIRNGDERFLAFQIIRVNDGTLTAYLRRYDKGTDDAVDIFDFEPREGEAFTLLMSWTETGKLTASVGRDDKMETREAEFGYPPEKLRIIASGGTMDITPLELGRVGVVISGLPTPPSQPLSATRSATTTSTGGVCGSPADRAASCTRPGRPLRR